jgi:Ca2+-transporting ATPase
MMLTGDYPETATEIARQAGLAAPTNVLTGADLRTMSDADLAAAVRDTQVFARVMPDQKLRLVEALLANREVVAMTGDGVNDAPALRRAHVGIAMGKRGTDVAREAAALVLTDDNFASIVEAIRQGRRIFANIRKASTYVLAIHLPIAGLTLVPVLLGWPLILLPFHVAALHLVIDPACSTVLEAEPPAPDVMRTPPRGAGTSMLERETVLWGLVQGLIVLAGCLALYGWALSAEGGEARARSLAFAALLVANVGLIVSNRSARRSLLALVATANPAARWVVVGVGALVGILYASDSLLGWFRMARLDAADWLTAIGGALVMLLAIEACKLLWRSVRARAPAAAI